MSDVASLGFAIDSRPIAGATAALKDFNQTATQTEGRARTIQTMADRNGVSFREMEARVRATQPTMGQFGEQSKKLEATNLTAAKAVNEVSNAVGGGGGSGGLTGVMRAAASASGGFSGSLGRIPGSLGAVGVALAAIIATGKAYITTMHELAQLGDTARFSGASISQTQTFGGAASLKGIDNSDFLRSFEKFGQEVEDAKRGVGELAGLFRVNGAVVKDTASAFERVADLVRNAASDQQKFGILQDAGLPATREWAKLMEQGGAGIKAAGLSVSQATAEQIRAQQQVEKAWNEGWARFEKFGKSAIVNVAGKLLEMVQLAEKLGTLLLSNSGKNPFKPEPFSAWAGEGAGDALDGRDATKRRAEMIQGLQRTNARIGLFGELPRADEKTETAPQPEERKPEQEKTDDGDKHRLPQAA